MQLKTANSTPRHQEYNKSQR